MQDFKKLDVWHHGIALARRAYSVAGMLPAEERFELRSQIRRASVSIPSNIAEGAGRRSREEFVRFLRIAYGSACELETQLILAESLGFVSRPISTAPSRRSSRFVECCTRWPPKSMPGVDNRALRADY